MPKPERYLTLDGLRGVGALVVLLAHMPTPSLPPWPTPTRFVAVDLFFVLSGIVLGQTYWKRLQDPVYAKRFVVHRAIRFLPLHLAGLALPVSYLAFRWFQGAPHLTAEVVFGSTALNALFLPAPAFFTYATDDSLFPNNFPAWSLMYELISNLAFAALAVFLTMRRLWWLVAGCAGALTLAIVHHGTIDLGVERSTAVGGLARVMFGFFVGVLLSTLIPRVRLPNLPAPVLMALMLAIIYAPVPEALTVPMSVFGVVFVVPAFLLLAACSRPTGVMASLCAWSGRLSFGIYMLHIGVCAWMTPVLRAVTGVELVEAGFMGNLAVACVTLVAAFALDRWYDAQLRAWLMEHLPAPLKSPRRTAPAVVPAPTPTPAPQPISASQPPAPPVIG